MAKNPRDRVYALERSILRALCQKSLPDSVRQNVTCALAAYRWQIEDHRIVFAALEKAGKPNCVSLREQLPAHATRMGFPDVDWGGLFEPGEPVESVEQLVSDLKAAGNR